MAIEFDSGTGAPRARRYRRVLGQTLAWIVLLLVLWFLWPSSLGGNTSIVIVSGSSMEPTYFSGDVVYARDVEPQIGDAIVYAPESLGGAQVVHRIIGGDAESGWTLQGDNNDFVDPFYPKGSEVKGVVQLHIPNAGSITMWLLNPLLWCALILLGAVILIWPGRESDDSEDESERSEDESHDSDGARQAVVGGRSAP